ncbi:short chain dehydrogenase reductase family protein, putative [Ichthyophthirius multifiliis]|uniref:Short chain dehydrogenase reductase family protein, putative n=1 Tax=Ichthyophthirius multifiliis TaxID=5932 RepID=G0QS54_ICHMU|nr:short chain dehydrogenase reductase family protein, putative [Ichthyophthirius multifiliis]EGR31919.1 short chain dehydrogenase reductase family protein, putative [Ichthyophthirius multifiliis]|eukprot:XP_004035405.1 short chain dehydrogenase reductase family protein, putative [Ichthyophthirius multifiliis]
MYQICSTIGLLQLSYQAYNFIDYVNRYYFTTPIPLKDQFPQKYALITGGTQGLGYGYAEELARRGYNIILASRSEDQIQKTITDQNQII